MPSYVIVEKCDGCKAQDKTACQYICPNDLMILNRRAMKAYQPGAGAVLGVLQLREDLPPAGHRSPGLCRLMPLGASIYPDAGHRLHHVDRQVPEPEASNGSSSPSGPLLRVPSIASRAIPCPATWRPEQPGFYTGPARKE